MSEAAEDPIVEALKRTLDERAARELYDRYVDRLIGLARRRISQRLASRVDPEDIVQSVFRTFFGRLKAGQFHINDQDDLCKLLMRITVHKTLRQIAFHKAGKRDPSHETGQEDEAQERLLELLDRDPSPEAEVAFLDQLEHFMNGLGTQERQILELRLQGYSNEEIAEKLDIYDRKIRRVVERIRGKAEREGLTPDEAED
jgi:RNA polymerase sigma-70 factor (ECF subfamily)